MIAVRSVRRLAGLFALLVAAGCDSEGGSILSNQPPNTRLSSGPPEGNETSYQVNLFWFGWDDDGFVDYYEIAWETPTEWVGPIFGNDSLFAVAAAESCCSDPLPEYTSLPDSVFEQFHTFFVRSVDDDGKPDETPAVRSFNAKTIAPYTTISFGPSELGDWGTEVQFNWVGNDDDGVVVGYRTALSSREDIIRDTGIPDPTAGEIIAWLDTITYYPDFSGGYYTDSLVWRFTEEDSIIYPSVTTTVPPNRMFFAVRAIDNAGAVEQVLQRRVNTRFFSVLSALNGPSISLVSNILGTWVTGDPPVTRDVFAGQGLRFNWRATPGPAGVPVAGFGTAVDDTSLWSPFSPALTEFPEQIPGEDPVFWFPDAGAHTLFVRAIDQGGFVNVLAAQLQVFQGPRFHPASERYLLLVLDTDPGSLQGDSIWPLDFEEVELGLMEYYFEGFQRRQIHETRGRDAPSLALLDKASSVFWFHSTDVRQGDSSILKRYHEDPPNPLPSYIASGGNFLLCGLQPSWALRYFENVLTGEVTFQQNEPVSFQSSLTDTTLVDHWMATLFGIAVIQRSIGNTNPDPLAGDRLRTAKSQITAPNPYPDLPFDPLTWPRGAERRGFGFYDRGLLPLDTGVPGTLAQVVFTANTSSDAIALRRLTEPGVESNVIYLGFHPYFVERPAFRQFVRAVLTDFGEFPAQ